MNKGATFSGDRVHRYHLWREWDDAKASLMVIGLNPSTADENLDDPTIRKCIGFAKLWGFGRLEMTNLFGFRATDPRELIKAAKQGTDVVGPDNDKWLRSTASNCLYVFAAWGNRGHLLLRDEFVADLLRVYEMKMFYRTALGQPVHPLYIPYSTPIVPFA